PPDIHTLSLHDALPIWLDGPLGEAPRGHGEEAAAEEVAQGHVGGRPFRGTRGRASPRGRGLLGLFVPVFGLGLLPDGGGRRGRRDRKSTPLNSNPSPIP